MSRRHATCIVMAAFIFGFAAPAQAHHPGHAGAAYEGARTLSSMSHASPAAQSRVLVLHDLTRTTEPQSEITMRSALGAEYAWTPWISTGAEAAIWAILEQNSGSRSGLGDARIFARLTPHGDKLIHRVLTATVSASLPTRTTQRSADEGRPVSITPSLLFTRTYDNAFWQLLALSTIDTRHSGTAIDVGLGGQLGYRFFDVVSPAIGITADTRVGNWCENQGGSFCSEGRTGEADRALGSTRVSLLSALNYELASWSTLIAGAQIPVTSARDFQFTANIGVQYLF